MKTFNTQLSLVALTVLMLSQAAQASTSLFELKELPHMATGSSLQVAEKCGAGSCGGKTDAKDKDHKCGKDKDHKCGKDKDHKCGKDKDHKCGAEKDAGHPASSH